MLNLQQDMDHQFSGFHDLMKFRVREILIVSSMYDAFVLEQDGRLSEKIMSEYADLNLSFVPRVTRVSSAEEAFCALRERAFNLVITMPRIVDMDPFEFGRKVKDFDPGMVVVLLTYNTVELERLVRLKKGKGIDKIFYWSGDSKILLAIVKYVEDLFNIREDTGAGVRVILIVEDSPLYYSSFLPLIYTEIMTQTRLLISESVNAVHRLLRMRARPKIMLAETFEEAVSIFEAYRQNILGVISDIRFPIEGKPDPEAGLKLVEKIKSQAEPPPVLLQSSEPVASVKNIAFLDKNSQNFLHELRTFIQENFGFGDFIFRYPDGREAGRAKNLHEMEQMILTVPAESLDYHARRNHISTWLMARSEFEAANELRPKKISDYKNIDEARDVLRKTIRHVIESYQHGIIADFEAFERESNFVKLGAGSLGGKGRSIAFINSLLARADTFRNYEDIDILVPKSIVICTEVFEEFLTINNLEEFAIKETDDDKIVEAFIKCPLPVRIQTALKELLDKVNYPLAVRSSSLLEDSHFIPFAGLYSTYMLPNNNPDITVRLTHLCDAIKLVYASLYYQSPKAYGKNTHQRIEEQKMAVIVQQIAGEQYGDFMYPVVSGVAQSYNFYPFERMKHEDGFACLALGMGKTIGSGGKVYSFSPAYPAMNPLFSSPAEFMKKTQSQFYALNLGESDFKPGRDDSYTLKKLDLSRAEADGTLFFTASTYSIDNQVIRDTISIPGPRIITFANILKYGLFPLSDILKTLLKLGENAFACPVEIEFAVNLYRDKGKKPQFYFLQIRPWVTGNENFNVDIDNFMKEETICTTIHALGNGIFEGLQDIIYVDPDTFDVSKTLVIAKEIEKINRKFILEEKEYILAGFGRWGTSDPWLGIPVEWAHISQAKVIVEANLKDFKVDPSQGSHFFHNITSLRIAYFHVQTEGGEEFIDWKWLKEQPLYEKCDFVRHIRFDKPLTVKIDGRSSKGVILKP
ncbi:MAG: PEP/pyruvate-binding domain-containing protein [Candidatus Eremiobacterota bacterium]